MFVGMYNQYRYEDNPRSVEDYLIQVPRNLVLAYAFDVSRLSSTSFGAKYWSDLDQKWRRFINDTEERRAFEFTALERAKEEAKKEAAKEMATKNESVRSEEVEEDLMVKNDWSGLDLVNVKASVSKKIPMPDTNEIRINTKNKNVLVINSAIVHIIDSEAFDTMNVCADRRSNRMVLVFGKNRQYNVNNYSTDVKCVHSKDVIELLERYLAIAFDPGKYYYIKIAQRIWSNDRSSYAVILSQRYQTNEEK